MGGASLFLLYVCETSNARVVECHGVRVRDVGHGGVEVDGGITACAVSDVSEAQSAVWCTASMLWWYRVDICVVG